MSGRRDKRNRAARARTEAFEQARLTLTHEVEDALAARMRQRDSFAILTFGLDPDHEDIWPALSAESGASEADLRATRDLYPHLTAIADGDLDEEHVQAVMSHLGLYAYGAWLPGGLLDAFGFHLLDALSDIGLDDAVHLANEVLRSLESIANDPEDADTAVGAALTAIILQSWVNDARLVRGLSPVLPWEASPEPVLTGITDGNVDATKGLIDAAAAAFGVLAHCGLHARTGPDGTPRDGYADPEDGHLFRPPGVPSGAGTAPPRTRVDGVYGTGAPQPWTRFGPKAIPPPDEGTDAYAHNTERARREARAHITALWWPVASHSTDAYREYLRRTGLGDDALVTRMVSLRPHIEAIFQDRGTDADTEAVADSGDVPGRRPVDPPVWLGGAVLDVCGAAAVAALTEQGERALWGHLLEAKRGPYDPAVHLLGCWLQDAVYLWRDDIGMTMQYLAVGPPLLEEDAATAGGDRRALAAIAAQALHLLTLWNLHLPVTPDGRLRNEEEIEEDPYGQATFRALGEVWEFDGDTEANPLPPYRPRPFSGLYRPQWPK